jgi:arylsulfatase A-like enzyme
MVVKFSENKKESNTDDRFLNFIDLAPSILSLAGIEPPKIMQGKALLGKYKVDNNSEYLFATSDRFDGFYDRVRAVRSRRYKYIKNFNTEISNALPIKYRKQMPMMQKMREMFVAGELNATQSQWFNASKPTEELYDLQNDPNELINLLDKPELQDTLVHLRTVLNNWIKETNDLGETSEKELMRNWLVDGKQPKLNPLEIIKKDGKIILKSNLSDATILWKQPKDSLWNIYSKPLASDISFEAKAERIGYSDSPVLEYSK